jgi:DNA replication protein DnaC
MSTPVAVDLFKTRIVPPDEVTLAQLLRLRRSKKWTNDTLHELDRMQAFTFAQIPERYWELSTSYIQDRSIVTKLNKYGRNFKQFIHDDHLGLMFHGEPGRGKSFLAANIAIRIIEAGFSVWVYNLQAFKDNYTGRHTDEEEERFDALLEKADVMVFDNFDVHGSIKERDLLYNRFYNVLRRRQGIGSIIVTHTSRNPQGEFPDHVHSLLKEMTYPIHVQGPDLRDGSTKQIFDSAP